MKRRGGGKVSPWFCACLLGEKMVGVGGLTWVNARVLFKKGWAFIWWAWGSAGLGVDQVRVLGWIGYLVLGLMNNKGPFGKS